LNCLHCPTGKRLPGRQKGFLTFHSFKRIIDELSQYIYVVDLFNWGEPLLNREIFKIIDYAKNSNICTNIHSNFNVEFNQDVAEHLIRSGLSYLTLSLDGTDQEVYSIYRRNGNFEKVIENARLLIEMKKKLGKQHPYISWQFLVFPHNRHQIERASQLANTLGFDGFSVLSGVGSGGLARTKRDNKDEISKMKDIEKAKCDWLWTTATVHWDGGVAPCCLQFKKKDDFASITHNSFKTIWNNEKFIYARSLFAYNKETVVRDDSVICSNCCKVSPRK
jgi:MoaA/NifB/PqqE/SkfB family radical SAM enzyme